MKIKDLLKNIIECKHKTEISGISSDSRKVRNGDLFLAYPGEESDGRNYIENAIENGASAIVAEYKIPPVQNKTIPIIQIKNLKQHVGKIADRFFGSPSKDIQIIGVTGTNGKTSTCFYIAEILNQMNIKTAVIGTTGYGIPGNLKELSNTTPGPVELQKIFFKLKNMGVKTVAMEVSSHALVQDRISNIEINAAVFTNLSQDHLDYHQNMFEYANAKKILFTLPSIKYASCNIDDAEGKGWFSEFYHKIKNIAGYSANSSNTENTFSVIEHKLDINGLEFSFEYNNSIHQIKTELIGHFNISNILAAVSILTMMRYDLTEIVKCCSSLTAVPGRMQIFRSNLENSPLAVVDYAHTPDALDNALTALRKQCKNKLICVFGCGGNRDRKKRSLMAKAVEKHSDLIIVTNDNPRFENELQIIEDIKTGFSSTKNIEIEPDRKKAIDLALSLGKHGDIILIAGKGHEEYQIINGLKSHFSDAETVNECFLKVGNRKY